MEGFTGVGLAGQALAAQRERGAGLVRTVANLSLHRAANTKGATKTVASGNHLSASLAQHRLSRALKKPGRTRTPSGYPALFIELPADLIQYPSLFAISLDFFVGTNVPNRQSGRTNV